MFITQISIVQITTSDLHLPLSLSIYKNYFSAILFWKQSKNILEENAKNARKNILEEKNILEDVHTRCIRLMCYKYLMLYVCSLKHLARDMIVDFVCTLMGMYKWFGLHIRKLD